MKVRSSVVALTIALISSSLPTANALFGFTKCEKVQSSIQSEQRVGRVSWSRFDSQRRLLINQIGSKKNVEPSILIPAMNALIVLYQSNIAIGKLINSNPKCFSSAQVSDERASVLNMQNDIKGITKDIQSNFNNLSFIQVSSNQVQFILNIYTKYVPVIS